MALLTHVSDSIIALSGRIEIEEVKVLKSDLEAQVSARAGSELIVDLVDLATVSSVTLSLLLCALRAAGKVSCRLSFANMPLKLFDIMRVGGLEPIIPRAEFKRQ